MGRLMRVVRTAHESQGKEVMQVFTASTTNLVDISMHSIVMTRLMMCVIA
jgi:hypothetical protein